MIKEYKANKQKVNEGVRSSKIPDDKSTNISARNEKIESNGFEWSLQKVNNLFNPIELTLILYEWVQSKIHKNNHDLGEYVLTLSVLGLHACIQKDI